MVTKTLLPGMGRSGENDAWMEIDSIFTEGSETANTEELAESIENSHPIGIASTNISFAEG